MQSNSISLLLVEDNESDAEQIRRTLVGNHIRNQFFHVTNGEDGISFLLREKDFAGVPPIDLLLLDINLPGISGHDVLKRVRAIKSLRDLAVVMLTTSESDQDFLKSYENLADAYIAKPFEFEQFMASLALLTDRRQFGLSIVRDGNSVVAGAN